MKQLFKTTTGKLTVHLIYEQLSWSFWYFGVMIIIFLITYLFNIHLLAFTHQSLHVYMFIIGIIANTYIRHYIRKGVTRKELFLGIAMAASILSIILTILSLLLDGLFSLIQGNNALHFLEPNHNLFSAFIAYSINIMSYYFVGWLVGVGYRRYGWIIGFFFVVIAIYSAMFIEFLWMSDVSLILNTIEPIIQLNSQFLPNMMEPIASSVQSFGDLTASISGLSFFISYGVNILFIGILLLAIRHITKNITVKVT